MIKFVVCIGDQFLDKNFNSSPNLDDAILWDKEEYAQASARTAGGTVRMVRITRELVQE